MRKLPLLVRHVAVFSVAIAIAGSECAIAQTPLGIPNNGNVPPSGSPVQIDDCVAGKTGGALVSESDRRFKIVFTNEGRITADLIRFRINFGTESLAIRDAGTFAPGITITHVFKKRGGNVYASPLFAPAKLSCSIDAIHFTDGSVWTPAAATASRTRSAEAVHGSGWIGVEMEETSKGVVAHLLIPNGPARAGGMMQGDVIQKIDDQQIATVAEALTLISPMQAGSRLKITVSRSDGYHDLIIVVRQSP